MRGDFGMRPCAHSYLSAGTSLWPGARSRHCGEKMPGRPFTLCPETLWNVREGVSEAAKTKKGHHED